MCPSTSKVVSTACGSLCGSYGGGPPCIGRRSGPCIFYGTNTNEKLFHARGCLHGPGCEGV